MMVHWHEGLFLLPQHLQLQQKFVLDSIAAERPLIHRFGYGVIDLDLNLTGETISVRRLKAIMPGSGVYLEHEKNAFIAPAKGVAAEMARSGGRSFKVSVALPEWSKDQPNAFDIHEEPNLLRKRRYCLREDSVADENRGGERKPVWLRQFNARLLLESESDQAGMEILPLARIHPSRAGQQPTLDEEFAPPLLRLKGCPALFDMVHKLVNQMVLARRSLKAQLLEGTFNLEGLHGNQMELLLRLRTVSHFLPRLDALSEAEQAAPFEVFCEMASLCGELMALDPACEPVAQKGYPHDSPADAFAKLNAKICEYLEPKSRHSYVEIRFAQQAKDRSWRASVDKALLEGAVDVFVRAESSEQRDNVIGLIASATKCGLRPGTQALRAGNGVPLKYVNTPKSLAAQQNFHYFRVERDVDRDAARQWKGILDEQEAAIYISPRETTKVDNLSFFVITSG